MVVSLLPNASLSSSINLHLKEHPTRFVNQKNDQTSQFTCPGLLTLLYWFRFSPIWRKRMRESQAILTKPLVQFTLLTHMHTYTASSKSCGWKKTRWVMSECLGFLQLEHGTSGKPGIEMWTFSRATLTRAPSLFFSTCDLILSILPLNEHWWKQELHRETAGRHSKYVIAMGGKMYCSYCSFFCEWTCRVVERNIVRANEWWNIKSKETLKGFDIINIVSVT